MVKLTTFFLGAILATNINSETIGLQPVAGTVQNVLAAAGIPRPAPITNNTVVYGAKNTLVGNRNTLTGSLNTVRGYNNNIVGNSNINLGSYNNVVGSNNLL